MCWSLARDEGEIPGKHESSSEYGVDLKRTSKDEAQPDDAKPVSVEWRFAP